jgi:23S rRNA pseudouridine1911/1915/1917 synthase
MSDNQGEQQVWRIGVNDAGAAGTRLDAFLAASIHEFSRNRIKEFILSGAVTINGGTITEPKHKVSEADEIELTAAPPEDADPQPENIPLEILYEDDALIVINKPVGLVVHPAPGNPSGTLVNALLYHCGDSLAGIGGVKRPGIVHRLDKDTSGVMVAAKTDRAMNKLAAQFADHGRTGPLSRAYIAYVWGRTQAPNGTVNAPLGRDNASRLKQSVRKDGKEAITHYKTMARFGDEGWDITKLKCQLETGRTHQIRVHMAHIGHPLLADPLYATGFATKANRLPETLKTLVNGLHRQALHAALLGFEHPKTGEYLEFQADLPADLQELDTLLAPYDRSK